MKIEVSAGVIVYKINENNERLYLLLLYPKGYWDFPKGHIENSESKLEAAIRELKEETDLAADIFKDFEYTLEYFFKDNKKRTIHKYVTFFTGMALSNKIILSKEHLDYTWLNFQDALNKLNFENAKLALSQVEDFLNQNN